MARRSWFSPKSLHTKDLKMVLDTSLLTLSIIRYISRVKRSNPGEGVVPSPTPRCSSYWKRSLLVALDYDHQLYLYIRENGLRIRWLYPLVWSVLSWDTKLHLVLELWRVWSHPFIVITPRSTLTRGSCISQSPISGSSRLVRKLLILRKNTGNCIFVYKLFLPGRKI